MKGRPISQFSGTQLQAKIAKILGEFSTKRADVGISAESAKPTPPGEPGVVEYAAINEFGKPKDSRGPAIHERSFLRDTLALNRPKYTKRLENAVKRANKRLANDEDPKIDMELGRLGEEVRGDIVQRIANRISPKNADFTIKKKGSDVPLIDTGRLRQSIAWQVSKVNKGSK